MEYIITTAVSIIVAAITSIAVIWVSKKKLHTEIISVNRLDWLKAVRELVGDFIEIHISNGASNSKKIDLMRIKSRIALFLYPDSNKNQECLMLVLNECINNPNYPVEKLIAVAQCTLRGSWNILKAEAGFTERGERKIGEKVHKREDYQKMKKLLDSIITEINGHTK